MLACVGRSFQLNKINYNVTKQPYRYLWAYLNIIFNRLDKKRRAKLGPDRTCAEWILRNGGAVQFLNETEMLTDYNLLPPEGTQLYLKLVDASNSSIMHYGFDHFIGCKHLDNIILHQCNYIKDEALKELKPVSTLKHLKVTYCHNVTVNGLQHLKSLNNLKTLTLGHLSSVGDLNAVVTELSKSLPQCKITFQ